MNSIKKIILSVVQYLKTNINLLSRKRCPYYKSEELVVCEDVIRNHVRASIQDYNGVFKNSLTVFWKCKNCEKTFLST